MNKVTSIIMAALVGCGAYNSADNGSTELTVPFDSMPVDKFIYPDSPDYVGGYEPAEIDGNIGSLEQPWISAEYHGLTTPPSGAPCFASGGANCAFPSFTSVKLHVNGSGCTSGTPGVTQAQVNTLVGGFVNGLKNWNGHGAATVVETTAGGPLSVSVLCAFPANPDSLASTSPNALVRTQVANLPVGPHGGDPGAAQQYDAVTVKLAPDRVIAFMQACGFSLSNLNLAAMGFRIGNHEGGHVLGFDHVQGANALMTGGNTCSIAALAIPPAYNNALTHYNGNKSAATILDDGLPH